MATKTKEQNRLTAIGGEVPTNGASSAIETQQPYRVEVKLEGVCSILFHRWNCEAVESKSKAHKGSAEKKTDNPENQIWRNDKQEICIPGDYLRGSIVNAAKFKQDPRSPRKSASDLFKAGVISLTDLSSLGTKDWDYMDKRRVVIQRNAITRCRPAMNQGWKASFVLLTILPEYIDQQLLHDVVSMSGRLVGVGDFRPTYGRFNVIGFKILKD